MEVKSYADPVRFRSHLEHLLLRDEARNCLFLGITGTLIDRPDAYEKFHLWAIDDRGDPVAAAAMTPPHNLHLTDGISNEALVALAEFLHDGEFELPGVQGNRPTVDRFCRLWSRTSDVEADLEVEMGIHALSQVIEPPAVSGSPRVATLDDLELIVDWTTAFLDEADPLSPKSGVERAVRKKLGIDPSLGGTWLWEVNDQPVALSGYGGRTPNGIRIGPVYTPPSSRRRGYATALVARQSGWLLEQGRKLCFLFTDMANPTSNSIYRKIGYEKVGDARRYGFQTMIDS